MASPKLTLNVINVSFAGSPIIRVTSFTPDPGAQFISFYGDDDRYTTVVANSENHPTATLTTGDVGTITAIAIGSEGTLTGTYQDAKKQGGGNVVFTINNAIFTGWSPSQNHGAFGSVTAHFMAYSDDGQMSPFIISRS